MKHDVKLGVIASADKPKAVRRAGPLIAELNGRARVVTNNLDDPADPISRRCRDATISLCWAGTARSLVPCDNWERNRCR